MLFPNQLKTEHFSQTDNSIDCRSIGEWFGLFFCGYEFSLPEEATFFEEAHEHLSSRLEELSGMSGDDAFMDSMCEHVSPEQQAEIWQEIIAKHEAAIVAGV